MSDPISAARHATSPETRMDITRKCLLLPVTGTSPSHCEVVQVRADPILSGGGDTTTTTDGCMFVIHLGAESQTYQTLKCYLSAIRHYSIMAGRGDPFGPGAFPVLQYVLRGVLRNQKLAVDRSSKTYSYTPETEQDGSFSALGEHLPRTDRQRSMYCGHTVAIYGSPPMYMVGTPPDKGQAGIAQVGYFGHSFRIGACVCKQRVELYRMGKWCTQTNHKLR